MSGSAASKDTNVDSADKGKGKAPATEAPHDVSMGEEDSSSEDEVDQVRNVLTLSECTQTNTICSSTLKLVSLPAKLEMSLADTNFEISRRA